MKQTTTGRVAIRSVRLALPDVAQGVARDGCLPADAHSTVRRCRRADARLPGLFQGRKLKEDELIDGAPLGGATPLWAWIDEGAIVFSY